MPVSIGLPEIPKGGMDIDSLIKLAQLMEMSSENAAKYGTPGTPGKLVPGTPEVPYSEGTPATGGTVSLSKPWYQGIPIVGGIANLLGAPKATPISSLTSIPSDASVDPAAMQALMAGGTAYVKGATSGTPAVPYQPGTPDQIVGGTPGTPGLEELDLKTKLATYGLLAPGTEQEAFTTKGFGSTKFAVTKDSKVLYNPFNPDIVPLSDAESIPKDQRRNYVVMTQKDAAEEIGAWVRKKLEGGAQSQTEMMKLYIELNDLKSRHIPLRPAQKDLYQVLESSLSGKVGVSDSLSIVTQKRKEREAKYSMAKKELQTLAEQVKNSAMPDSQKKATMEEAINRMKSLYGEEEFFDIDTKAEKALMKGF